MASLLRTHPFPAAHLQLSPQLPLRPSARSITRLLVSESAHSQTSSQSGHRNDGPAVPAQPPAPAPAAGRSRRQALATLSAAATAAVVGWQVPALSPPVEEAAAAGFFDSFKRGPYYDKVLVKLTEFYKGDPGAVYEVLRLALHDAATYDKATGAGGANGSIHFREELERPENAGLAAVVAKLEMVKADLDGELSAMYGPISWADLIWVGGEAALKKLFLDHAIAACGGDVEKGTQVATAFGTGGRWSTFQSRLGRRDATSPSPSTGLFRADASVDEIKASFGRLGIKLSKLPVLAVLLGPVEEVEARLELDPELKASVLHYRTSRKEVTESLYEVDIIAAYTKLASLGAQTDSDAYIPKKA